MAELVNQVISIKVFKYVSNYLNPALIASLLSKNQFHICKYVGTQKVISKNNAQISSAELTEYQCLLCLQGSHMVLKVLNLKSGFQDLEKVLNLAKMYIRYGKSLEILN